VAAGVAWPCFTARRATNAWHTTSHITAAHSHTESPSLSAYLYVISVGNSKMKDFEAIYVLIKIRVIVVKYLRTCFSFLSECLSTGSLTGFSFPDDQTTVNIRKSDC